MMDMMQRCTCGTENPTNFRNCVNCGASHHTAESGCGFLSEIVRHRDAIDGYMDKIRFAVNDLTNLDWQTADALQHISRALRDVAERVSR